MHPEGTSLRTSWPYVVEDKSYLLTWLFWVPLVAYSLWQVLYFLIANVLRRQRLLRDPEFMTSYRELSKKVQKANNIWWCLSGLLGDQNQLLMYIVLQAMFTVVSIALTVPIFFSYELHAVFQILKVSAAVSNGGSFILDVMPSQLPSEAVVSHVLEAPQLHEWIEGATVVRNPDTLLSALVTHIFEAPQLLLVKT